MKVLVLISVLAFGFAADEDGRYQQDNSGQYYPSNEGQYIPDNSGQYIHDGTGGYSDDGTGRYSDNIETYRGTYSGLNGNLIGSSSQNRPILKPVFQIKSSPTPIPIARIPLQTYSNNQEGKWRIIKQLGDVDTNGYHWEFDTENKIIAEESGKVHNVGNEEVMRSKGSYQYTGPDNVVYAVQYTADENGFVPVGNHLPTPPPIPEEIANALRVNN